MAELGESARRRAGALPLALLAAGVLLLLALAGEVFAVRTNLARGPEIRWALGSYHLIGTTTTRPECAALPQIECFITLPIPFGPPVPQYVIWFGQIDPLKRPGPQSVPVTNARGRIVLRLPIVP